MLNPAPTTVLVYGYRQLELCDELFAVAGAWVVLTADIDVLDDVAVAFVSVVVETKA